MSIFSDIGNALSSAASAVANVASSAVSTLAPLAFPQLTIAASVANLITQGVGQAVNQAANTLCKEFGMPKFLADVLGKIVKEVVGNLTQKSDSDCDKACGHHLGDDIRRTMDDFSKSIVDGVRNLLFNPDEECAGKGGGKKGAGSWLVAIAKAMGEAAGAHAEKLVDLSNKISDLSGQGGDAAKQATALQAEFQAESQMFSMLQSAFSNAIKSIGEGASQMARKG